MGWAASPQWTLSGHMSCGPLSPLLHRSICTDEWSVTPCAQNTAPQSGRKRTRPEGGAALPSRRRRVGQGAAVAAQSGSSRLVAPDGMAVSRGLHPVGAAGVTPDPGSDSDAPERASQPSSESPSTPFLRADPLPDTGTFPWCWAGPEMAYVLGLHTHRTLSNSFPGGITFVVPPTLDLTNGADASGVERPARYQSYWDALAPYVRQQPQGWQPYPQGSEPAGSAIEHTWRARLYADWLATQGPDGTWPTKLWKQPTRDKRRTLGVKMVYLLCRCIPKSNGGGFDMPFFTKARFQLVANVRQCAVVMMVALPMGPTDCGRSVQIFVLLEKKVAVSKGGPCCSARNFEDLIHTFNILAQVEQRCASWLLLPTEYDKRHLATDSHYFNYDVPFKPASSKFSLAKKTEVEATAKKNARELGCASALKTLLFKRPKPDEWKACLMHMCQQRQLQVAGLLAVTRGSAQRGFDMQRLTLDDLAWDVAGGVHQGNAIPYLIMTPEGAKMHKVFAYSSIFLMSVD